MSAEWDNKIANFIVHLLATKFYANSAEIAIYLFHKKFNFTPNNL